MRLTKKLVSFLHRVFNRDPIPFPALRIACTGGSFTWTITDQPSAAGQADPNGGAPGLQQLAVPATTSILTITPAGGGAARLAIDLGAYTIAGLAAFIASQPGYTVPYQDTSPAAALSALILLNGAGSSDAPNGDCLFGYTSLTWALMDAYAAELETARTQIANMPAMMNPLTAYASWVDYLGAFFNVARQPGELDAPYGRRIVATVIRPLGNNVAIAEALRVLNDGLPVTVADYDQLTNNSYGLFDVDFSASLDLLDTTTTTALIALIEGLVDQMRMAGTFMRTLSIVTSVEASTYVGASVCAGSTVWIYPSSS
ncbi:MAG TPA: hypothetical protein VF472_07435 [Burkholderiaceae bacterium]